AGLLDLDGKQQVVLPALTLLPILPQLSSYASYLPAQVIEQKSFARQNPRLSRQAVLQLYEMTKVQPVLGHTLCDQFLRIRNLADQMSIGLAADALLFRNFDLACRHLRFVEPDSGRLLPPGAALYELFTFLILHVFHTADPNYVADVAEGLRGGSGAAVVGAPAVNFSRHDPATAAGGTTSRSQQYSQRGGR
ncbi:unnamed protein product, partial [Amoebophrya sp. A120]